MKNQKNLGNLYISWKERDLLIVHVNGDPQGSETLDIPRNYLQPSIKLAIFLVDVINEWTAIYLFLKDMQLLLCKDSFKNQIV